jgi:GDPmannose 4,6-dehydratase
MRRTRVVFLVNGEAPGAMGVRAKSFADRLQNDFDIRILYRSENKLRSLIRFFGLLLRLRPALCYVFDMGFSGVIAAVLYRGISGCRVAVDTGDAIYELAKSAGNRGRLGLMLTGLLERIAVSGSDRLIVRSHRHQELYQQQGVSAEVIPDGVDTKEFYPQAADALRRQFGLEDFTVIGLLGSLIWNSRLQICYGWELIEMIGQLQDLPVKGLIIGDGSGLPELKAQCAARGMDGRIVFAGRIPYDRLPEYLNLMDIGLSTQTNDIVGQVRTTGKLPLYLASGLFVLATEVGEAARVLPPEMLVSYEGTMDETYPGRLAERIRYLLQHPQLLERREASVAIAREHFEYTTLAERLRQTFYSLTRPSADARQESSNSTGIPKGPGRLPEVKPIKRTVSLMKKALITGITGQDGSYLAQYLLELGYEVHGLVRRVALEQPEHRLSRLQPILPQIQIHAANLDSYASIFHVLTQCQFDECYHLAAQSFVAESFADGFSTMQTNINGTHYVLAALREVQPKCKFYFAGSSEMFGKVREMPQKESTPFHPRSPYGISKVAGFYLTMNYREAYDLFGCNGILFNHESPRRGFEFVTRKITHGVARIRLGLASELRLGNLEAKRDWGHARDYVRAMHLMLQQPSPDDYVIATGETHSVREFCELAFAEVGLDYRDYVKTDPAVYRPAEVDLLVGDSSKARTALNWDSKVDFMTLIKEMVHSDIDLIATSAKKESIASPVA